MLFADLHVHLYPHYSLTEALRHASLNLLKLSGGARASYLLALTERHDCHYFRLLFSGELNIPSWTIEKTVNENGLILQNDDGTKLFLVAGRQIVSAERLELLALTADVSVPDGLPFREAHREAAAAGAVTVLNWAPGKWMFGRRPIVEGLLEEFSREELLLCDTTLRPLGWGEPTLITQGKKHGLALIAGSDPLPFRGEEKRLGNYGITAERGFNPENPVESLRELLKQGTWRIVGRRSDPVTAFYRMAIHAYRKN